MSLDPVVQRGSDWQDHQLFSQPISERERLIMAVAIAILTVSAAIFLYASVSTFLGAASQSAIAFQAKVIGSVFLGAGLGSAFFGLYLGIKTANRSSAEPDIPPSHFPISDPVVLAAPLPPPTASVLSSEPVAAASVAPQPRLEPVEPSPLSVPASAPPSVLPLPASVVHQPIADPLPLVTQAEIRECRDRLVEPFFASLYAFQREMIRAEYYITNHEGQFPKVDTDAELIKRLNSLETAMNTLKNGNRVEEIVIEGCESYKLELIERAVQRDKFTTKDQIEKHLLVQLKEESGKIIERLNRLFSDYNGHTGSSAHLCTGLQLVMEMEVNAGNLAGVLDKLGWMFTLDFKLRKTRALIYKQFLDNFDALAFVGYYGFYYRNQAFSPYVKRLFDNWGTDLKKFQDATNGKDERTYCLEAQKLFLRLANDFRLGGQPPLQLVQG